MEKLDKNVPKLRFKEFSGEWKNKEFDKVFSFMTTNSLSRDKLNYECGTVKNIHYGDIHTQFPILLDAEKEIIPFVNNSVSLEKFKTENYCKVGDILFADASEDMNDIGKNIEIVNIGKHKILSGLHVLHARPKKDDFVTGFCGYLFRANIMRSKIKNEAQGAKVLGISKGRVSTIDVVYPTNKKEQQKIADCLSSLDERINLQEKKLENLKKHKQGLMQQLFPDLRGGVAPSLRFMGFTEDWSEKVIIDIANTSIGLVTTMTKYYTDKGVPLIRNSDIKQNNIRKENLIYLFDSFAKKNSQKKLKKDDIVTIHTGDIGTSAVIDSDMDGCLGFATLNTRVISKEDVLPQYLCWYYNSESYINFAISMATGDGRSNFNLKDFNRAKIPLPTLAEQQKIADCLSSLDELITANNDKIIALKQHKKGMMQGLFPKVA